MNPAPAKGESLQGQAIDWLMRLDGTPDDPALRAEFESWLARSDGHRRAYAAVELAWGASTRLPPLTPARRETARTAGRWQALRSGRATLAAAAIAACIILVAFPALQLRLSADYATGTAELRDVVLTDGSRIVLDGRSAVAVDYTSERRNVRLLSGEAFFEVMPSSQRPFVVTTEAARVTVTGTTFDVATSRAGVSVSVRSGSVDVTSNAGERVAGLAAGQRAKVATGGAITLGTIDPGEVGAWRERRLIVYDAVLRDVVEQVGRHTPSAILFADAKIADSLVSGIVDLERPAEALHALVDLQQGRVTTISPYLTVISSR